MTLKLGADTELTEGWFALVMLMTDALGLTAG
jgi:hypothetical protein